MHLRGGLSPSDASLLCRKECRAKCCRGASYVELSPAEIETFRAHARRLGVAIELRVSKQNGSGEVRFLEHANDCCPMLDQQSSECRIYAERPTSCRDFPRSERPGCLISGGEPDAE